MRTADERHAAARCRGLEGPPDGGLRLRDHLGAHPGAVRELAERGSGERASARPSRACESGRGQLGAYE